MPLFNIVYRYLRVSSYLAGLMKYVLLFVHGKGRNTLLALLNARAHKGVGSLFVP